MNKKHQKIDFRQILQLGPFLESVRRSDPDNEAFNCVVIDNRKSFITASGFSGKTDKKVLWYKDIDNFSISSFRKLLKKAFDLNKMRYSEELGDSFLHLYSYFKIVPDPVSMLEEIFSHIQNVSLCQYFLIPAKIAVDFKGFKFGEFTFGELDERKLAYRCERATSDYFKRYQNQLKNKISIEREFQTVPIIVWQSLVGTHQLASSFSEALLIYFEKLSDLMFQDFWISFSEQQSLQVSLGIPYINVEKLMRQLSAEKVTIFSNIDAFSRSIGYVVPMAQALDYISFPYLLGDEIKKKELELLSKYKFIEFTSSEIHKTMQSFSKFIAKAYIHLHEGRINEAFLHFVIALDLLFGDKGENTQTVSKRAAVLTYLTFDVSFEEQKKILLKIYDLRSRYVHSGINVEPSFLKSLMGICRIILEALFDLQAQQPERFEIFTKWLKKLDYVIISYDAEVLISKEELKGIGIYKRTTPVIDDF
jgi:hypothetical protein